MINKRKDGSLYTETATISPVRDSEGHIANYVAIKRDITDHLRLESQFIQAQKMEAIGVLAGGVAHDFNNLLNVINGYSELVLNGMPADHPMRIVYQHLFGCGPVSDGDWDAPALLFALGVEPQVFSVLGRGGAAVINSQGGLSWQATSTRRQDVYVHVADQRALNASIERLLAVAPHA